MESNRRKNCAPSALASPIRAESDDIHRAPRRRVFEIRRNILRKLLRRIEGSRHTIDARLSMSEH